jgi:hypothetical protein
MSHLRKTISKQKTKMNISNSHLRTKYYVHVHDLTKEDDLGTGVVFLGFLCKVATSPKSRMSSAGVESR